MAAELHQQTLTELAAGLESGDFSSVELTEALLARIADYDGALNAFITVTGEQALVAAKAADSARAAGKAGVLTGLPLVHKDIFCTRDVLTTCGSRMLENFVSPYNATVVDRLADAGAGVLGKTNMDEFAMGSSNETSWYGPVRNPWDLSRSPGGSSGGSSAASAATSTNRRRRARHRGRGSRAGTSPPIASMVAEVKGTPMWRMSRSSLSSLTWSLS